MQRAAGAAYAKPGSVTPGTVEATAGQIAQQSGASQVQASQQTAQREAGAGQTALGEMGLNQQAGAFDRDTATSQLSNQNDAKLSAMSLDARRELLDGRVQLAKNRAGQIVLNTSQQVDLAASVAQNSEDLKDFAQTQDQATSKHIQQLKFMYQKLEQELANKTTTQIQEMQQQMNIDLKQAKQDLQLEINRRDAEQANRAMQYGAGLGVLGGVLGAYFGGPQGAQAGAGAGYAAGGAAAQAGY